MRNLDPPTLSPDEIELVNAHRERLGAERERLAFRQAEYCCHACGYIGNESAYPDGEATTYYEKDADSNYLWHEPACPKCGEVEPFGYTSDCPFNHDA